MPLPAKKKMKKTNEDELTRRAEMNKDYDEVKC